MAETTVIALGAAAHGAADVALFRRDPWALADLPLGRFSDAGIRSLLIRRLLLRLPWLARPLHVAAGTSGKAAALLEEVAYWSSARSCLTGDEWARLTKGPVILMYHALGGPTEKPSRYVTPRRTFERHVRWLRSQGYRLVSLRELIAEKSLGLPAPRTVALTFDDGYEDNFDALLAQDARATVFVVTGAVGGANHWDADSLLAGRRLFGWDQAHALVARGVEIGGHSRNHPALTTVDAGCMETEVRATLEDLRRELGEGLYTFAYPHGRFDEQTMAAVAAAAVESDDARFSGACCSRGGVNDPYVPLYALRRVEIKGTDSFMSFQLMVRLGRRITVRQLLRSLFVG